MKRYVILFLILLTTLSIGAQQADYSKMSAFVRHAAMAASHSSAHRTAASDRRVITAFVQVTDDNVLDQYGCRIYAKEDDIAIATIPLGRLTALASHPAVLRIEAGETSKPLMDTVPRICNILPAYHQLSQAFTGKGVILGLMDIGFDLTHPNFFNNSQLDEYRIKAFWDMLSQDTIGSTLPVGRDFVGPSAVLAHQRSVDGMTQTHGTHTLGIAAGSGYLSNYRGVAYESDICLVSNAVNDDIIYIDSADYYKFTTATDALGFKYLFDYAQQQNKPCVASFSEGYTANMDEDDRLYAEFLEKLTGPGRIIVVAAGNENRELTYAEKPLGKESAGAFIRCFNKTALYRMKADGPMAVRLFVYGQGSTPSHTLTMSSSDGRLDSLLTDTLFINNDTCAVSMSRYPSSFNEGETVYLLQLNTNRSVNNLPPLALVAEGKESRVEIYGSSTSALAQNATDPRWNAATSGRNILAPACFPAVICVGGTSYRLAITNDKGETIDASNTQLRGLRMRASSTGPSMNGLMKPDVTAPGYNIISSYSSFYMANEPSAYNVNRTIETFDFQGRRYYWNAESGTSMSCPVVAGIIALWLQAKPTLTRQEVMDIFRRTCTHLDTSLNYPNNQYGFGEIDAYRGLLDILNGSNIPELSVHQPKAVAISAAAGCLLLQFSQLPSSPVAVRLYALSGTSLYNETLTPVSTSVSLSLPVLPAGIYAVQITSSEHLFTGSGIIRL